jgi:hypothetical protein
MTIFISQVKKTHTVDDIETRFFLSGIHQKYSSSSKCVDNRDIRMNKKFDF